MTQATPMAQAVSMPPSPPGNKNALVAALLNLFWGVGYLYLGYKKVLSIPTIGFVIVMLVVYLLIAIFTFGLGTLLLAIILAIDGYQKAKGETGFVSAQR